MRLYCNILLSGVLYLCSQAVIIANDAHEARGWRSMGDDVRKNLEVTCKFETQAIQMIRREVASQINRTLERNGYKQRSPETNWVAQAQQFSSRSAEWVKSGKVDAEILKVVVIYGEHGCEDAREGLFQVMGAELVAGTETDIFFDPDTFGLLKDGVGDYCFIRPPHVTGGGDAAKIERYLWFVRDNIGVELACSGKTNLLPLARVLDRAIQACPSETAKSSELAEKRPKLKPFDPQAVAATQLASILNIPTNVNTHVTGVPVFSGKETVKCGKYEVKSKGGVFKVGEDGEAVIANANGQIVGNAVVREQASFETARETLLRRLVPGTESIVGIARRCRVSKDIGDICIIEIVGNRDKANEIVHIVRGCTFLDLVCNDKSVDAMEVAKVVDAWIVQETKIKRLLSGICG